MTTNLSKDSDLPEITEEDRDLLHFNPNTDDLVEFVRDYARKAIAAQTAMNRSAKTTEWIIELQQRLMAQSAEIASECHDGWGNTMAEAACLLKMLQSEVAAPPTQAIAKQPDDAILSLAQDAPLAINGTSWIPVEQSLPEERAEPYQVIVACKKTLGGMYEGKAIRRFQQDWVVRQWPYNFTHWMHVMPWPAAAPSQGAKQ